MIVVNLISGPAAGKSTMAAFLFGTAKKQGYNVEFVSEYAKDMVWEDRSNVLEDQLYILAKQNRRLHRLRESVDYVITDTSLLLGALYAKPEYYQSFFPLVQEVFDSYTNINVWIARPDENSFSGVGRVQKNFAEAEALDAKLWATITKRNRIDYIAEFDEDPALVWEAIVKEIKKREQ